MRRTAPSRMGLALAAAAAVAAVLALAGCTGDREQRRLQKQTPDLILVGGTIHTMDPDNPTAEALAIVGDRISIVGDRATVEAAAGDRTRTLDLQGQTAIPGMMDTQIHFMDLGRSAETVDLVGTLSVTDVQARLWAACDGVEPGRWVFGAGWDQNDWPVTRFPSADDLAEVCPANPIYLERIGRHVYWVNQLALERAGVNKDTEDVDGGRIGRDHEGEPDGLFFDNAQALIDQVVPSPSAEDHARWIPLAQERCLSLGLTAVGDSGTTRRRLRAYESLAEQGGLEIRIYVMVEGDPAAIAAVMEEGPRVGLYDHHLTVRTIKGNLDGTMGARGAAMLEPYSDDPENSGSLMMDPEELQDLSERALQQGFQMDVHAIGDRATRIVLDAYAEALRKRPTKDHRFRIEHAQLIDPDDLHRFEELGVIAMMQPTQATSDMGWVGERLGPGRLATAYAWRSVLDSGARVAFGSDYPVESADPLWGIYAAVTRQDHQGNPPGGWIPEQRITAEEALRAYTLDAAYACFEEEQRGSLEVGKLADVVVLDRDILAVAAPEILEARVTRTLVGGQVVYELDAETVEPTP